MVNSVFEPSAFEPSAGDKSLMVYIGGQLGLVEQFFVGRLAAAQRTGALGTSLVVEDVARHLLSVLLGVRVLARVRPEAALLTGAVGEALKASGLPPLPPRIVK
jgi:TetR/AcrR family transcriptional repressor of nem operon